MVKINKGMTLIELIIYMNIFFVIFIMIMSSMYYVQKIIQNNNQNYYIKNQIYNNFNLLQQYLFSNYVEINNNNISFLNKDNDIIFSQIIENGEYKNIYKNMSFVAINNLKIESINMEFMNNHKLIKYTILYKDPNQKMREITEYLIVINQNT